MKSKNRDSLTKKLYRKPQLTVWGGVEEITQKSGFSTTDVPLGTAVAPDGITSVAS